LHKSSFSDKESIALICDSLTDFTYTFIVRPIVLCVESLNGFIVNAKRMKVGCEATAESVPAVPL